MKSTKHTVAQVMGRAVGLDGLLVLIYWVAIKWVGHVPGQPEVALIVALLFVHWVMMFGAACINAEWQDDHSPQQDAKDENPAIDPWEMQRLLMAASGQERPTTPVLNKGGLLYAALLMEETGETMTALSKVLKGLQSNETTHEQSAVLVMRIMLHNLGADLDQQSRRLRDLIGTVAFNHPLSAAEAEELLDGTTDVAVVNCGLALACGLPGPEAYHEIVCSNLSKANPVTGIIDKTADGKWIKGRAYFKPDLSKVLKQAGQV